MSKKWVSSILVGSLVALNLVGCNMGDDDIGPDDDHITPVRYNNDDNLMDNDLMDDDYQRDIRQPGEMDTPFNMDEEEPDLDEEPSEQREDRRDY
ncbi:hypothetical protein CIB95_14370 [Lottiidibacillus patelloidae]|uniref:Uncharacterized protein n=1 Tax=Lottiidibacillus patelloidae TaxID=2670334 RepID=A0A263BQP0_9BACI|nr:hypothetical protein [Lottiidibacillus patelloidae]OZM56023.1 hypothetical protein CIB95_14370 [Lottiidibacillus patelloidae]